MKPRLELYVSQTRTVGLLLLTCVMVGGSYFCTTLPPLTAKIAGWAGVAFFSLGFIAIPRQLMRTGPQFVIDERGLEDRRSPLALIEWCDIVGFSVGKIHGQKFLCIDVSDEAKYLARLSTVGRTAAKANEGLGFSPISIGFSGLSKSTDEVMGFITENYLSVNE